MAGIFTLLFCFLRFILTLGIFACAGLSAVSDLDSLLRYPLHSWGPLSFSRSLTFSEGVNTWSENISNCYRVSWLLCPVLSLWEYLLLPLGIRPSDRLSGGIISGGYFWSPNSLWWQGLQAFWRDCFAPSWGICSLTSLYLSGMLDRPKSFQFYWGFFRVIGRTAMQLQEMWEGCTFTFAFLVSWQRRCRWDAFLLSDGIYFWAVFPHVLWGE